MKKKLMLSVLMGIILIFGISCAQEEEYYDEEEIAAEEHAEKLAALNDELLSFRRKNSTDYPGIAERARKVVELDPKSSEGKEAARILEVAENEIIHQGERMFRAAKADADKLIEKGDYDGARSRYLSMNAAYQTDDVKDKLDEELKKLDVFFEAKDAADKILKTVKKKVAQKDYAGALEEINKFEFDKFSAAGGVVKELETLKAECEKSLGAAKAEDERIASLPWYDCLVQANFDNADKPSGDWKIKYGQLIGTYNGSGKYPVVIRFGQNDWRNMYVDLVFKHKGKITFGVRGTKNEKGASSSDGVGVVFDKLPADKDGFRNLRIKIEENGLYWGLIPKDGNQLDVIDLHGLKHEDYKAGTFDVYLFPGAEVQFKTLKIKVIDRLK